MCKSRIEIIKGLNSIVKYRLIDLRLVVDWPAMMGSSLTSIVDGNWQEKLQGFRASKIEGVGRWLWLGLRWCGD